MLKKDWQGAVISVLLAEGVGLLAMLFSGNIRWQYMYLYKPFLAPPGWVFGVVWPVLYAAMGLAAWLVWEKGRGGKNRIQGIYFYGAQLFVNFLWPIVFFRFQWLWIAFLVILVLDGLVFLTTRMFDSSCPLAGRLMLPYLVWILYATYLNFGFAVLN